MQLEALQTISRECCAEGRCLYMYSTRLYRHLPGIAFILTYKVGVGIAGGVA